MDVKKLIAAWKWMKWVLVALGGVILVILGVLVRGMFTESSVTENGKRRILPQLPEETVQRADQIYEEALTARIEASTVATEKKEELERIVKIDDGVERRRQLAAMLRRL